MKFFEKFAENSTNVGKYDFYDFQTQACSKFLGVFYKPENFSCIPDAK